MGRVSNMGNTKRSLGVGNPKPRENLALRRFGRNQTCGQSNKPAGEMLTGQQKKGNRKAAFGQRGYHIVNCSIRAVSGSANDGSD